MLFSAGPVASIFWLVATVRSVEVCRRQLKAIKHQGSSQSKKTINERRTGNKNRATEYLNLVEENVLSSTMTDDDDP